MIVQLGNYSANNASLSGQGCWVLSQVLLLLHFRLDNGGNVCGLEFNYDNPKENEEENTNANENDDESNNRSNDQEDTISLLRGDLADSELLFNDQIFRQLFLGFEVNTEKGGWVQRVLSSVAIFYSDAILFVFADLFKYSIAIDLTPGGWTQSTTMKAPEEIIFFHLIFILSRK